MRKFALLILLMLLVSAATVSGREGPFKHRFGFIYGLGNLKSPEKPYFSFNHGWGFFIGTGPEKFGLNFSLFFQNNYSDSSAANHFGFFANKDAAEFAFKSVRAGFDIDYRLKESGRLRPKVGVGLGYLIWKYADPVGDTVIQTLGDKNNTIDFSAAEMYLSASAGLEMKSARRLVFDLSTSIDYLTGIGTAFGDETNDDRGRLIMRTGLKLSYLFGREQKKPPAPPVWPSEETWSAEDAAKPAPAERDSDGDGINDRHDECPNTPRGAYIDDSGCPVDSDGDGVYDGLDDCPLTPLTAAGFIDIFGCPIDSDFDGVPDFRDHCRTGPVGTPVDENGCPVDSDDDGVYDGIDDCPDTEEGIEVDERGCIDISFLHEPMRINIDYLSGSFEIDERTKKRMQPLIRKLKILSDVTITIVGYTDNVGPSEANRALSQKRANRMRDWLQSQGIDEQRMKAIGKGETNFIVSNKTAEGRAKNRRIELVFSK
jgi:OOP family OmpA-OmpF porin